MSNLPILIVAAVPQEISSSMNREREGVEFLFTGIGRSRSAAVVRQCLARGKYRMVISTGFSGATQPGFRVGDLVTASEVMEASSGRFLEPARWPLNKVRSIAAGRFVTIDRIAGDPEAKKKLGSQYGTIAVDLETASVGSAAAEAQVPWVTIRAILDPMEENLRIGSWQQALGMLLFPPGWKEFGNFLHAIRLASESLTKGLEGVISIF